MSYGADLKRYCIVGLDPLFDKCSIIYLMRIRNGCRFHALTGEQGAPAGACRSWLPASTRFAVTNKVRKLEMREAPAPLETPTDLSADASAEISAALNALLADTFALYVKTK